MGQNINIVNLPRKWEEWLIIDLFGIWCYVWGFAASNIFTIGSDIYIFLAYKAGILLA